MKIVVTFLTLSFAVLVLSACSSSKSTVTAQPGVDNSNTATATTSTPEKKQLPAVTTIPAKGANESVKPKEYVE